MFERAAWADQALADAPFIDMTALSALADLFREVFKLRATSSNAPLSGASEPLTNGIGERPVSASTPTTLSIGARDSRRVRAGARARQSQQFDLFGDERQSAPAPTWQELPVETRAALTNLMARLILEHVQESRTGSATETGHNL